jgi:hypothetical protein
VAADDLAQDTTWSQLTFRQEELNPSGADIVVAVSLTHDVMPAVRGYAVGVPGVRAILDARLSSGPGARSVVSGRHAFDLAEALTGQIKAIREASTTRGHVHLFMAAPGAFSFFLGQRQTAIGPLTLYEYDFEGDRAGSYQPSLSVPVGD